MFRDYGRLLNQKKYPLPTRDDEVDFDVRIDSKEFENNIKLQGCPSGMQDKVKEVVMD